MQHDNKIRRDHLSKSAYVYVRQSTPHQVDHNLESQRIQYALVDEARALGFKEVVVIDDDLGVSAAGYAERRGFKRLLSEIGAERAGIILGSETARLARNGRDWHQLLDLCGLFGTLLAEKGVVYDPSDRNDWMVLALKGTMNEMEINTMKARMQAAAKNKAKRGKLIYRLPVGYVKTTDDRIEKDPNIRIQEAIQQVFSKFGDVGSVRQTFLWFVQEEIAFPRVVYGDFGRDVVWRAPVHGTIMSVLENPCYAGAYAIGRRETRTRLQDGEIKKTKGHPLPMDEWEVLLKGNHEGYISWEQYEKNRALMLENSKRYGHRARRGPVLKGTGLLAGLLRCIRCGKKLQTAYGGKSGSVPRYSCSTDRVLRGKKDCMAFGGLRVDQAVVREVLRVVEPMAIEAAVDAEDYLEAEVDEKKRLLVLELESARYDERRAYNQYSAVDPDNRLVCRELESRWESCLKRVDEIKRRLVEVEAARSPLDDRMRKELHALTTDLPRLWDAPSTTNEIRKRITRTVIEEIVADVDKQRSMVVLKIHWTGGVHTTLEVKKNRTGEHGRSTDKNVVEIVRQLARQIPDERISPILNRLGFKTGAQNAWTRDRVRVLRHYNKIPSYDARGPREFLTLAEAASELGTCAQSVLGLIKQEVISAHQVVPCAPWCIRVEELEKKEVKAAVARIKRGDNRRERFARSQSQKDLFL